MNYKKISLFIDGANFYEGIKRFNKENNTNYTDFKVDFWKMARLIYKKVCLMNILYYNAPFKQQYDKKLYQKQQGFFSRLRNTGIKVSLLKRNNYDTIKGDDVNIAVDILYGALLDCFDWVFLISGDADYIPVIEKIQRLGKKVLVSYFKEYTSKKLRGKADQFHHRIGTEAPSFRAVRKCRLKQRI
jgi:uncharacterized LabA/DUF88 family protein